MIEKLILIHNYGKFKHFDIAMSDWDGTFKKQMLYMLPMVLERQLLPYFSIHLVEIMSYC